MVGMVLVLIAAVVVVAVIALAVLRGRPRGADLDSVRSYHSALGTLEHLSERNVPPSVLSGPDRSHPPGPDVRPGGSRGSPPAPDGGRRHVPPVPVRSNGEFPDPGTPLVFDDARPRDRYRGDPASDGVPAHRVDRAQRHALESMNHRPRRGAYLVVAAVAVAAFAVLAYSGSKHPTPAGEAGSSTTTAGARGPSSTTTRPKHSGSPVRTPRPTPTTLPSVLTAVTSTDTSATYTVPFSTTYQLTVTTSAPSWVQVTSSTRSTLWAGTLQPGSTQVVQAVGAITVQIGVPSVTLAVGSIPVALPALVHTPFVATFQPVVPTTPSSTTTPPTAAG